MAREREERRPEAGVSGAGDLIGVTSGLAYGLRALGVEVVEDGLSCTAGLAAAALDRVKRDLDGPAREDLFAGEKSGEVGRRGGRDWDEESMARLRIAPRAVAVLVPVVSRRLCLRRILSANGIF